MKGMTLFQRLKRLEDAANNMIKPPLTDQEHQALMAYLRQVIEDCGPPPELTEAEKRANMAAFKRELEARAYPNGRPA